MVIFFDENNSSDVSTLLLWKERALDNYVYESAIRTWTVTDLMKRDIALQNKLNYKVFWDNDLSDFKGWLEQYRYFDRIKEVIPLKH